MSSDPQADSALDTLLSIGSEAISTSPIASVQDTALGRQLGDLPDGAQLTWPLD